MEGRALLWGLGGDRWAEVGTVHHLNNMIVREDGSSVLFSQMQHGLTFCTKREGGTPAQQLCRVLRNPEAYGVTLSSTAGWLIEANSVDFLIAAAEELDGGWSAALPGWGHYDSFLLSLHSIQRYAFRIGCRSPCFNWQKISESHLALKEAKHLQTWSQSCRSTRLIAFEVLSRLTKRLPVMLVSEKVIQSATVGDFPGDLCGGLYSVGLSAPVLHRALFGDNDVYTLDQVAAPFVLLSGFPCFRRSGCVSASNVVEDFARNMFMTRPQVFVDF